MATITDIIVAGREAEEMRRRVLDHLGVGSFRDGAMAITAQANALAAAERSEIARLSEYSRAVEREMHAIQEKWRAIAAIEGHAQIHDVARDLKRGLDTITPYALAAARAGRLLGPSPAEALRIANDTMAAQEAQLLMGKAEGAPAAQVGASMLIEEHRRHVDAYRLVAGSLASTATIRYQLDVLKMPRVATSVLTHVDALVDTFASTLMQEEFFASTPAWLQLAPPVAAYTGTRLLGIASGMPSAVLDADRDDAAEEQLERTHDGLEARLRRVDDAFAPVYRGALDAAERQGPDWIRHACTSMRELLDHLLNHLAAATILETWTTKENKRHFSNGEWTRRAQLEYIFRDARTGGTECLTDKVIDLALSIFFPQQSGVHTLIAPHPALGMRLLLTQFEGVVSSILDVAGY